MHGTHCTPDLLTTKKKSIRMLLNFVEPVLSIVSSLIVKCKTTPHSYRWPLEVNAQFRSSHSHHHNGLNGPSAPTTAGCRVAGCRCTVDAASIELGHVPKGAVSGRISWRVLLFGWLRDGYELPSNRLEVFRYNDDGTQHTYPLRPLSLPPYRRRQLGQTFYFTFR